MNINQIIKSSVHKYNKYDYDHRGIRIEQILSETKNNIVRPKINRNIHRMWKTFDKRNKNEKSDTINLGKKSDIDKVNLSFSSLNTTINKTFIIFPSCCTKNKLNIKIIKTIW